MNLNDLFRKLAAKVSQVAGNARAFIIALIIIILWALTGPAFGYSDTWQLVINTSTTVVTLLMVFIIQNTQNRNSKAIHLKLDELLRSLKGDSHDRFLKVEDLPDTEIEKLENHFRKLHARYTKALEERRKKKKASTK